MIKRFHSSGRMHAAIVLMAVFVSFLFYAYSTGITGATLKNGSGCTCHGSTPTAGVTVTINGPSTMVINETANFSVTISGGTLTRGGTNIAASGGILTAGTGMQKIGDELTHTSPAVPVSGTVTFNFTYKAPATAGNVTLYANGNSVDFTGGNNNDNWNFAANKIIQVTSVVPVELNSLSAVVAGNSVELKWVTATETNNKGFYIERKNAAESDNWQQIGFVAGKGTTSELSSYTFRDAGVSVGTYNYRLIQTDLDGSTRYYVLEDEVSVGAVADFNLMQNYPNPFNPSTVIGFSIPTDATVRLSVYDVTGSEIAVLVQSQLSAGYHSYNFDASRLTSGVYYYSLTASSANGELLYKAVNKMLLTR